MARHDGRHARLGQHVEAPVVDLHIAQQEPVHAPGRRQPGVRDGLDLLGHAEHEVVVAARQRAFDAGQEAHEERIDLEPVERA